MIVNAHTVKLCSTGSEAADGSAHTISLLLAIIMSPSAGLCPGMVEVVILLHPRMVMAGLLA
jgi:hypothetical protein